MYFLLKVSYNFFIDYEFIRSYYDKEIAKSKQENSEFHVHWKGVIAFLNQPGIVIVKRKLLTQTLGKFLVTCLDETHFFKGTFWLFFYLQTGFTTLFLPFMALDETLLVSNINLDRFDCGIFAGIVNLSKLLSPLLFQLIVIYLA